MIYVGINIAKLNHFLSVISSDGKILIKPFKFTNDSNGFQMSFSRLSALSYKADNLIRYLVACNCNVCVEPHQNIRYVQR